MADRTPFVETELLIAVMEDNADRGQELMDGLSYQELVGLERHARRLAEQCVSQRTGRGWRS